MKELNYEKVFNTLVKETGNYITNNHLKCMVLGISGGIDSTVVAAICHEVSKKTGIPLIGRSLPIKNKRDEFDVSKLVGEAFCDDFDVANLYAEYREVLSGLIWREERIDVLDKTNTVMSLEKSAMQTPIANGNIQARLRMIYLYNLASIHKGLVMSTDNQTEYQLGFWTIHGDVGDFDPIQDLWKTEVYELAKWIFESKVQHQCEMEGPYCGDNGVTHRQLVALAKSIELTPTDGLGISNSDLDQIGAKSYADVDDILDSLLMFNPKESDGDYAAHQVLYEGCVKRHGKEVVDKVWARHKASTFKREKAPIYIPRERYA